MRDLTEEELKLAPEWATHYQLLDGYDRCKFNFVSEHLFCNVSSDNELSEVRSHNAGITVEDIRLPKKPFDITKHEFSDKSARVMFLPKSNKMCFEGEIHRPDAIAIAKALGVTGEDLK